MIKFFKILFLALIIIPFGSCKNEIDNFKTGEKLEFYLLDEFETLDNKPEIIELTAMISDDVFINYTDIVSYKSATHTFVVSEKVVSKLLNTSGVGYHKKAFALTIDKEVIYTGYFWYGFSSTICDWITIDPILSGGGNALKVNLAYPTNGFASSSYDPRNDQRILCLLKKDRKLIN